MYFCLSSTLMTNNLSLSLSVSLCLSLSYPVIFYIDTYKHLLYTLFAIALLLYFVVGYFSCFISLRSEFKLCLCHARALPLSLSLSRARFAFLRFPSSKIRFVCAAASAYLNAPLLSCSSATTERHRCCYARDGGAHWESSDGFSSSSSADSSPQQPHHLSNTCVCPLFIHGVFTNFYQCQCSHRALISLSLSISTLSLLMLVTTLMISHFIL